MTSRSHVQRKASSNSSPAPQSFLKSRLFPTPSEVTPHQVTLEQQVQLEKAQHFHQNLANIPLAPLQSFPSSIQPKFTIGAQRGKSEPEADRLTKQEMQHLNTFTAGRDVLFRQGEYQPRKRGGQELIVRELAHVVQKRVGDKCLLAENSAWNSDGGVTLQMVDEKNILGQKSDEGLIKGGFTGTVHKGSIGKSTGFGHEFLILFLKDPEKERILDIWLSQQTKESPLIRIVDYKEALEKLPNKGDEYSVNQKKKSVGDGKTAMFSLLAGSGVVIGNQLWPQK